MAEKFPKEIYLQGNLRLDQETTKRKDARFHDKIYKDPGPTQRPNNSIPLTEFIQEKIDNKELIIEPENPGSSLEFENGIKILDNDKIGLGGELTEDTIIDLNNKNFGFANVLEQDTNTEIQNLYGEDSDGYLRKIDINDFIIESANIYNSDGIATNFRQATFPKGLNLNSYIDNISAVTKGLTITGQTNGIAGSFGLYFTGQAVSRGTGAYISGMATNHANNRGLYLSGQCGAGKDIVINPSNSGLYIENINQETIPSFVYTEDSNGKFTKISLLDLKILLNSITTP